MQPILYDKLIKSKNLHDVKYGNLLRQEVLSLKTEIISSTIYKKAVEFRHNYKYKPHIRNICLDFELLEQKALEFALGKNKKKKRALTKKS